MTGIALTAGVGVGWTVYACRRGHQTICCGLRQTFRDPRGRLIALALSAAFLAHLLHSGE